MEEKQGNGAKENGDQLDAMSRTGSTKAMNLSRASTPDHENDEHTFPLLIKKRVGLTIATRMKLIPEGEWGWVICAAAFVSQFIVMGIHNSFGILYTKLLEEYKKSKAQTAWVGSVSIGVMYLLGPITSGLCQRFGCRVVAFLGGVLCILGMLLTSFVSDLGKLYVTYGILWGMGSSFCYFPTLTAPGEYFCRRLSLVNGIVTTGSGIGTLTFGPVLQYILQRYTLATCLQILSGVSGMLLLTSLMYRPFRSPLEEVYEVKRQPGPFIDLTIWQNKAFCAYTAAVALFMLGYFIPYVHLVSHAEGLGIQPSQAALLIGYMSIASTISRFFFGKFSDHPRVNRLYMTQLAVVGFGVTTTLCPLAKSYAALVAVVVALGLFDGLYVVLIAVLNTDIVGVHKLSQALGSLYGVISLTIALGPPCAGLIFDMLHSYHTAFYICGATSTLAACLMFLIPWLIPNQQGGEFRRDSCQSRLESLLCSQAPTPEGPRAFGRFFARSSRRNSREESTGNGTTRAALSPSEVTSIEREYMKGFLARGEEDGSHSRGDTPLSDTTSISMDTTLNTAFNSSMSGRGSITKFLLQQQLQSRTSTPTSSSSRRGSTQSPIRTQSMRSSLMSSLSSFFGGSAKSSEPPSPDVDSDSKELSEPSSDEPQMGKSPELLQIQEDFRRGSGESTVVGSRWDSGQSTVVCSHRSSDTRAPFILKAASDSEPQAQCRSVKSPDMMHLLVARLLQATGGRPEYVDDEERESVV